MSSAAAATAATTAAAASAEPCGLEACGRDTSSMELDAERSTATRCAEENDTRNATASCQKERSSQRTARQSLRNTYVGKDVASSSSQNTSALEVVQLVDRAEINQICVSCNDKCSHSCEKLGLLSGYVLDLTEGYNSKETGRGKLWRKMSHGTFFLVNAPKHTVCQFVAIFRQAMGPS